MHSNTTRQRKFTGRGRKSGSERVGVSLHKVSKRQRNVIFSRIRRVLKANPHFTKFDYLDPKFLESRVLGPKGRKCRSLWQACIFFSFLFKAFDGERVMDDHFAAVIYKDMIWDVYETGQYVEEQMLEIVQDFPGIREMRLVEKYLDQDKFSDMTPQRKLAAAQKIIPIAKEIVSVLQQ